MLAMPARKGPAELTVHEELCWRCLLSRWAERPEPGHEAVCSLSVCPRARGFPPAGDTCRSALGGSVIW